MNKDPIYTPGDTVIYENNIITCHGMNMESNEGIAFGQITGAVFAQTPRFHKDYEGEWIYIIDNHWIREKYVMRRHGSCQHVARCKQCDTEKRERVFEKAVDEYLKQFPEKTREQATRELYTYVWGPFISKQL